MKHNLKAHAEIWSLVKADVLSGKSYEVIARELAANGYALNGMPIGGSTISNIALQNGVRRRIKEKAKATLVPPKSARDQVKALLAIDGLSDAKLLQMITLLLQPEAKA